MTDTPTFGALVLAIHRRSLRHPNLLADHAPTGDVGRLSAVEALGRAHALALALEAEGLESGDRVAVWSRRRSESLIVDLAAQLVGAVWVPIAADASDRTVRYVLRNSQARWLFFDDDQEKKRTARLASMLDEWAEPPRVIAFDGEDALPWTAGSLTRWMGTGAPLVGERPLAQLRERARPDRASCLCYRSRDGGEGFDPIVFDHAQSIEWVDRLQAQLVLQAGDRMMAWRQLDDMDERAMLWATLAVGGAVDFTSPPLADALEQVAPTLVLIDTTDLEDLATGMREVLASLPGTANKRWRWALEVGQRFVRARSEGTLSLRLRSERWVADRLLFRQVRRRFGGALRQVAVTDVPSGEPATLMRALGLDLRAVAQPSSSGVKTSEPSNDSRSLG